MGQETCNPIECVAEVQKAVNKAYVNYARKGFKVELKKGGCQE